MPVDGEMRDGIRNVRRAFDSRFVDAVLYRHRAYRSADGERLTDHALLPTDKTAGQIEPGAHFMQHHRSVAPPGEIVLAGPHQMDRRWAAKRLGDCRHLGEIISIRRGATTKRPAGPHRVELHTIRRQPENCRDSRLFDGLK